MNVCQQESTHAEGETPPENRVRKPVQGPLSGDPAVDTGSASTLLRVEFFRLNRMQDLSELLGPPVDQAVGHGPIRVSGRATQPIEKSSTSNTNVPPGRPGRIA